MCRGKCVSFFENQKLFVTFYLRVLLLHVHGATSYENLRSVYGTAYDTFKAAAIARHLLESDEEWVHCLDEAVVFQMPPQMRHTFAYILVFGGVADPLTLWRNYYEHMIDFQRRHNDDVSINLALHDINSILLQHGQSCAAYNLPEPTGDALDQPTVDQQQLRREADRLISTLNPEQSQAFQQIVDGVTNASPQKLFYLNGPGGSGKTYLYGTLIKYLNGRGIKTLAFATTGIAATLLENGRTAHSGFGLPMKIDDSASSNMKATTAKGRALIDAQLLIIDEVTMMTTHGLRVINDLLQRLMGNALTFGGKAVVISGDFRQTLPVVRGEGRAGILEVYLKRSDLWGLFTQLSLISNMRSAGHDAYNIWPLNVGIANIQQTPGLSENAIEIPRQMIVTEVDDLLTATFGNDITNLTESELAERVILCSTNSQCLEINNRIIESLPAQMRIYNSADSIESDDANAETLYTPEFINNLQPSGLPPHELRLKKGAIVMLLRNLNPNKGLCNGTRLIVRETHVNSLRCEILSECCKGDVVLIPRINLSTSGDELPFQLKRRQFPLIPAFAVTINKSQGQTYQYVGILLNEPVFAHGQLYVALSRSRNSRNVKVFIREGPRQGRLLQDNRFFTENIVYAEVFN